MSLNILSKKTGAVVLICSMFFSLCGCSMFSKKDVLAAAREVAENIENFDAERLLDLSTLNKNGEKAEDLRKGLNGEYLDENTMKFCKAVRNSISFKIREETFSAKGNDASVDIDFILVDYSSLLKKDYKNIDELVSAVRNCDDTDVVTFNAQFVKEDGQWLLDNLMSSGFLAVFDFMNADLGALAVDLSKIVNGAVWDGANESNYENARRITLKVELDSAVTKLKDKGVKMTYTVSKDGNEVWTSDPVDLGDKTILLLDYSTSQNPGAEVKSGYLAEGTYKFTLKADNGTEIYTSTANVKVNAGSSTTSTTSKGYKFYDNTFAGKVINAGWANVNNKLVSASTYGSDATAVQFQIQVDPSMSENLYFAYFYASNLAAALKINVRSDTPAISGTSKPIVNANGTFYAMGLKTKSGSSMKQGIWILAVFSEDKSTLYALGDCQVLTKPASDYKK